MTNVRHSVSWQPPLLASFNVTGKREKARLEKTKWKENEALSFVPFRLERRGLSLISFFIVCQKQLWNLKGTSMASLKKDMLADDYGWGWKGEEYREKETTDRYFWGWW